jgi:hypothetical protein
MGCSTRKGIRLSHPLPNCLQPDTEDTLVSLDDALLLDYMQGFHGYGSYEAPYWFVGMEEGSTGSIDEITNRISVWAKRGKPELDDLVGFHHATGLDWLFKPDAPLQPTWRGLIRLFLAAEGISADVEQVRNIQRTELGRMGGTNALIELFPLPSKSTHHWLYADHSSVHCLRSRKTYYQEVGPARIRHLRERMREHQPKAVICYGLSHRLWWEQIAGPFAPSGLPRLEVASCGSILVALIPHTSQGVSNRFLEEAGATIAAFPTWPLSSLYHEKSPPSKSRQVESQVQMRTW